MEENKENQDRKESFEELAGALAEKHNELEEKKDKDKVIFSSADFSKRGSKSKFAKKKIKAAERTAKATAKTRLEAEAWTLETPDYDERRFSPWWCARVDFSTSENGRLELGTATGIEGKPGMLSVRCRPGDYVAYGQKDLRRPASSTYVIGKMLEDGSIKWFVDKAEAYKDFRDSLK